MSTLRKFFQGGMKKRRAPRETVRYMSLSTVGNHSGFFVEKWTTGYCRLQAESEVSKFEWFATTDYWLLVVLFFSYPSPPAGDETNVPNLIDI